MSDAKKCDYCGVYYDFASRFDASLSGRGVFSRLFPEDKIPVRLDFCPECAERLRVVFKVWWDGRTISEEIETEGATIRPPVYPYPAQTPVSKWRNFGEVELLKE